MGTTLVTEVDMPWPMESVCAARRKSRALSRMACEFVPPYPKLLIDRRWGPSHAQCWNFNGTCGDKGCQSIVPSHMNISQQFWTVAYFQLPLFEWNTRVGRLEVAVWENDLVLQHQDGFDEGCDSARRLEMTDVCLH